MRANVHLGHLPLRWKGMNFMRKTAVLKWLGMVLIILGCCSTTFGLVPPLFLYGAESEMLPTTADYWKYMLLEDPTHWLWQIGILVAVTGIILVNKAFKTVQLSHDKKRQNTSRN
jgi:hypothetical protein